MQIFCDEHSQIVDITAGVRMVVNPPTVTDEPVLQGSSPVDACGATIYGSVIRDDGVYRMWYQAWPEGWDGIDVIAVGCVESDDGLTWRRPDYGILEFNGNKKNHLTDLPFHSTSVMIDPDAPTNARYRAFGYADPKKIVCRYIHKINRTGYFTAHSADGLHWTLDSEEPLWPYADVITAAWDPYANCVKVMLKKCVRHRGMIRRVFFSSEWKNGQITPLVTALVPDEFDDIQAQARGFNSADYYGMGWLPTPGATIGFLWNFRHQLPVTSCGNEGRVDISLIYQLERGGRWFHVPGRPDWLGPAKAPEWARGGMYTAASALDVGDETWLYFCGTLDGHGWCGAEINYLEWIKTVASQKGFAKIGVAKWKKNRLIGCKAIHPERITLRRQILNRQPGRLVLNGQTKPGGSVRVRLTREQDWKSLPGFDFVDCEPLTGDFLEARVRWKGRDTLPSVKGQEPFFAQIEITQGTLWAFDF
jgi:hypothetical protein